MKTSSQKGEQVVLFQLLEIFKNLGFQRGWTEPYVHDHQNRPWFWGPQTQTTYLSRLLDFFFKPCPLPHLICSKRSVLCFCYTFSKCFLGLAPLLYCYTPRTYFTHLGSFLIRHMMAHHTAILPRALVQNSSAFKYQQREHVSLPVCFSFRQGAQTVQITWQFTWNFNC